MSDVDKIIMRIQVRIMMRNNRLRTRAQQSQWIIDSIDNYLKGESV